MDHNPTYTHTKPSLGKQFLSATLNQSKYCRNQIATICNLMSNETNLNHLAIRGFNPLYINFQTIGARRWGRYPPGPLVHRYARSDAARTSSSWVRPDATRSLPSQRCWGWCSQIVSRLEARPRRQVALQARSVATVHVRSRRWDHGWRARLGCNLLWQNFLN